MAKRKADHVPAPAKVEKYTTSLKVKLTAEEVADRADRAAAVLADRDRKEDEQKAANKHAKSIIESLEAELRTLSGEVRNRSTYSQVACERRYDYALGLVTEIRLDTFETLNQRSMTDGERQMALPFDDDNSDD